jgi:uncharacterized membrane protein
MADIKFGTKQLNHPTPANINLWVRVFTVAAGVFMGWMATANIMGPNTKDILNSILGLLIGLVNGIAPLFGIDITSKEVPIEQVKAIDTTKE